MNNKNITTLETPAERSAIYEGPKEPKVPLWIVFGVAALLVAVAFFVFKFPHR